MHHDFAPTSVQDPLHRSAEVLRAGPGSAGRKPWLLRLARRLCAPGAPVATALQGQRDPCTGLLNRAGLLELGGQSLEACRRRGRPFSLVVFDCSDLLEVNELYGGRVSKALMDRVACRLDRLAGARGWAARTGPAQFAVALPGVGREGALLAIQRVLGTSPCIDLEQHGDEIVLVPDFIVQCADGEGTLGQLYRDLCAELIRLHELQQRRSRHLRRERERHSRPAGLAPAANDTEFRTMRAVADTVPMPLAATR